MSDSSEDKKHAASDTKLRKQREQGSVASSQESSSFLAVAFGVVFITAMAGSIWQQMQLMITSSLDLIGTPFEQAIFAGFDRLGTILLGLLLPIVGSALAVAFIAGIIYNKGILFAMKPVMPQLNRISPKSGFKRIYGKRGWIETSISTLRIVIWLALATVVGGLPMLGFLQQSTCTGICLVNQIAPIFYTLATLAPVLFLLIAAADMFVQRKLFLGEQKMTDTEKKRETKDQYGTPEIRQERRRRMREANQSRRKPGVDKATMCFYHGACAVGIEFKPPSVVIPHVVAKATTAQESVKLRKAVARMGWPELQHEGLTRAALARPEGDVLDEASFQSFIDAVNEIFSTG